MDFEILTLLPDFFESPLKQSIIGRASKDGKIGVNLRNIRDYALDKHNSVDDTPYGGGAGMLMMAAPLVAAIEAGLNATLEAGVSRDRTKVVLMTPQGVRFTQKVAEGLLGYDKVMLVCGRYEGIDERVRGFVDMELSIGDYILNGGESAALVVIEAVSRLLPSVIRSASSELDSFTDALLEYPQYTRPRVFRGLEVPQVLVSGDHEKIKKWREDMRLERTFKRRPDLFKKGS